MRVNKKYKNKKQKKRKLILIIRLETLWADLFQIKRLKTSM